MNQITRPEFVCEDAEESEDDAYAPDAVHNLHEWSVDIEGRQLYLLGDHTYQVGAGADSHDASVDPGIEYVTTNRFIKNMSILQQEDEDAPILVHLNTPGGSWTHGMAIYNAIKMSPCPITVLNYGEARSMSSLIPLAADYFVMMPESTRYMFHKGTVSFEGTGTQFETFYEQWVQSRNRMLDIYVKAMGREHSVAKGWGEQMKRDWLTNQMQLHEDAFLTAEQAVHYGFAHAIFDGDWESLTLYEPFQG
jgi:ATP-dependent Clp protease protease subunit